MISQDLRSLAAALGPGDRRGIWSAIATELANRLDDLADQVGALEQHGAPVDQRSTALADIAAERRRQIDEEGWTPEHDDKYRGGSMAMAAAAYAVAGSMPEPKTEHARYRDRLVTARGLWAWTGWASLWFKPRERRHDLIRAGALIVAEIERLDRLAATESSHTEADHE